MKRFALLIPRPVYAPDPPAGGAQQPPSGQQQAPPQGQQQAPQGTPSLLGGGQQQQPPTGNGNGNAPPTALPENWRDLGAAGNAERLAELGRYKSFEAVVDSLIETKKKVRDGSRDADPMPAADKVDELKAWREKHGVPADPTGYKTEAYAPKLTAEDKPAIDSFLAAAHKAGKGQDFIDTGLAWYTGWAEEQQTLLNANDTKDKTTAEDALRSEWGTEYRNNLSFAGEMMRSLIPDVDFSEARLPDGRKVGSVPELVKMFLEVGLATRGHGAFSTGEKAQQTQTRIAQIEEIIRGPDANEKYFGNPALMKEYGDLLAAQSKHAAAAGSGNGRAPT